MAFGETPHDNPQDAERALKLLARSMLRELKRAGFSKHQMVSFTSELLELVTVEIKTDDD